MQTLPRTALAVALGLLQPDETVDARRAAELILHPGLSTAAQITELSGRGIGMDAVQAFPELQHFEME